MAKVLTLNDGSVEFVDGEEELYSLVVKYMGNDVVEYIREELNGNEELRRQVEDLKDTLGEIASMAGGW